MSSVKRACPNWWIAPDVPDKVDSFSGLEILPMYDDLSILPFEAYGLWWYFELRDGDHVKTHGPFHDDEAAIASGMNLVD